MRMKPFSILVAMVAGWVNEQQQEVANGYISYAVGNS